MRPARPFAAAVLALAAALSAGCTASAESSDTPSPFAACDVLVGGATAAAAPASPSAAAALASPSAPAAPAPPSAAAVELSAASPSSAVPSADVPSSAVPDVTLPCFTGGDKVALRSVRGPAVINLWASWCGPCRQELPVMQQLADKASDKVTVVGVDTGDAREAGASFAAAKGVTFPTLFDPDKKLLNAVAKINLPITIFVDGSGKAFVNVLPLDAAKLTTMLREHAGVAVAL